ncbi:RNA polymerase-binding protein DksA [Fretibacter rubidus]|uniref:RNA polymerase-binding protein DksA n=1 Tax=Fretibacter rubidus TaxID=570162 RepID=UPI00352A629E
MTAAKKTESVKIPEGYQPSDEDEKFMNPIMSAYFRKILTDWRDDVARQTAETIEYLKGENVSHPDPADTAAANADRQLELRTRDRLRKLTNKIDKAIRRIDNGTYGYCEETGDPIRVRRLEARPVATLSIEAQEMHERGERVRAG